MCITGLLGSQGRAAHTGRPCQPRLYRHGLHAVLVFQRAGGEVAFEIQKPVIKGDSGDLTYDAALHGLGLSLKSLAHVWEDLRDGRLVAVMEDYTIARTGAIWAVYPPSQFVPPKVTAFVDFLISKYGRPPYWESDYRTASTGSSGS